MKMVTVILECEVCGTQKKTTHIDFTNWVEVDCQIKGNPNDYKRISIVMCDECAKNWGFEIVRKTTKETFIDFMQSCRAIIYRKKD